MVAGEQQLLFPKTKADVVGGVARGMDDLNRPAVALDDIAVADRNGRHKLDVWPLTLQLVRGVLPDLLELFLFFLGEVLIEADVVQRVRLRHRPVRPETIRRCVRPGDELWHPGGVIGVGVSDENVGHSLVRAEGTEDCVEVFVKGWAGVDDGYLSPADDVHPGPGERERVWVLCNDPTHQRRQFINLAVVGGEVGVECDGQVREVLRGREDR